MSANFPKYHMIVTIDDKVRQSFMSLGTAGATYDSGWAQVEIGSLVLMEDFTLREMTDEDRQHISEAADRHSESK